MCNGWPLGLEVVNTRIRVVQDFPAVVAEPPSLHWPSSSFSSFSSSNLDTESTASFFQDHSVSFGRLIGFRRRDGRGSCFPNPTTKSEKMCLRVRAANSDVAGGQGLEMRRGICIPLLAAIVKMNISKGGPKN